MSILNKSKDPNDQNELERLERRIKSVKAHFNMVSDDDLLESCIFYLKAFETEHHYLKSEEKEVNV